MLSKFFNAALLLLLQIVKGNYFSERKMRPEGNFDLKKKRKLRALEISEKSKKLKKIVTSL